MCHVNEWSHRDSKANLSVCFYVDYDNMMKYSHVSSQEKNLHPISFFLMEMKVNSSQTIGKLNISKFPVLRAQLPSHTVMFRCLTVFSDGEAE